MKFVDKYNRLIQYVRAKYLALKKSILCISSSKTEGGKVKTEKRNHKCKIVLRLEIHKSINRNTHADITIVEKILYILNSNVATEYWQHPLKFPIPACHCSMSPGIIIKHNEPS